MFGLNYEGMRRRETYDEVVDYIQNKQEKIKYPNRLAKQIRNTPQLSNLLDGEGYGLESMEKQNDRETKTKDIERRIFETARTGPLGSAELSASLPPKPPPQPPPRPAFGSNTKLTADSAMNTNPKLSAHIDTQTENPKTEAGAQTTGKSFTTRGRSRNPIFRNGC